LAGRICQTLQGFWDRHFGEPSLEILGIAQSGDTRKPGLVGFVRLCMASGIGILVSLSEILGAEQSGETLGSLVREALLIRVVVIRHVIFYRRVDVTRHGIGVRRND
jgi:hypothetical protein